MKNMTKSKKALMAKLAVASAALTGAVSANAAAIEFDTTGLLANIASGEGFAVTAGLAFIGLAATISVLRKSRGAVR
ncbi:hypothetical protein [Acinetobacter sp. WCHAc060025]|uniref:hypothetical protein n=1 Tax=Acinetobacter sp. WCHAc060025 TaxID=2518625 RepID=UPI001023B57A|nr:hypothetical protein [Acinetobacter sp. WCHAc060025]RZG71440.1 hypothetical protein EXE09_18595 [Acinetobacter sp. WCHAc060025]